MSLALFDLDNTLIAGDSDHAWGQFLAESEIVDAKFYAERSDHYLQEYESGELDIKEFLKFQLTPLTLFSLEKLENLRREFIDRKILPMMSDQALKLVEKHRALGDTLVIITATNDFITRPIADLFDIEHLIATELEIVDDRYTGQIVGEPCFRTGKLIRLNLWLDEHQESMPGSWFYSDSHNDLPLLNQVDNPTVVNPDPFLEAEAMKNSWPIIRFS